MGPYLLAAALLTLPLFLGVSLAWPLRRLRRPLRLVISLGVVTAMVATAVVSAQHLHTVGALDLLSTAFWASVGLLGATLWPSTAGRRELALLVSAALVALGLGELTFRLILTEPPRFPDPQAAQLVFEDGENEVPSCAGLYPDAFPHFQRDRLEWHGAPPIARILHVGDSLVAGQRSPRAFADVLSELSDYREQHVNGGVVGTGPGYYLLTARRFMERTHFDGVVFYYYLGNDFQDIDRGYWCCRYGQLLNYPPAGGVTERCPNTPDGARTLTRAIATSPAPYPLRVATAFSWIARQLVFIQAQLPKRLGMDAGDLIAKRSARVRLEHLRAILTALRDASKAHGAVFATVILPFAPDLVARDPAHTRSAAQRDDFEALARSLDIPVLDAWPRVEAGWRRFGPQGIFQPWIGGRLDSHYNESGHRWLAQWLQPRLHALGIGRP